MCRCRPRFRAMTSTRPSRIRLLFRLSCAFRAASPGPNCSWPVTHRSMTPGRAHKLEYLASPGWNSACRSTSPSQNKRPRPRARRACSTRPEDLLALRASDSLSRDGSLVRRVDGRCDRRQVRPEHGAMRSKMPCAHTHTTRTCTNTARENKRRSRAAASLALQANVTSAGYYRVLRGNARYSTALRVL